MIPVARSAFRDTALSGNLQAMNQYRPIDPGLLPDHMHGWQAAGFDDGVAACVTVQTAQRTHAILEGAVEPHPFVVERFEQLQHRALQTTCRAAAGYDRQVVGSTQAN